MPIREYDDDDDEYQRYLDQVFEQANGVNVNNNYNIPQHVVKRRRTRSRSNSSEKQNKKQNTKRGGKRKRRLTKRR